jgi:hypothetical protein
MLNDPRGLHSRYHVVASSSTPVGGDAGAAMKEAPAGYRKDLSSQPEWQLARRVAGSKGLSKSDLLPKFLLYICEQQLLGYGHEITEQRVGTQIFNRPADYNPGEDNIVRSYARLLRKRLDEYFEQEGRDEPMRIVVPRGGYVPSFDREANRPKPVLNVSSKAVEEKTELLLPAPNVATVPPPLPSGGGHVLKAWPYMFVGLIAGALLASAGWLATRANQNEIANQPAHLLWTQLFQRGRNTIIVPADSGLGILQNLSGHLVSLEEYVNGSYEADGKPVAGLGPENLNDLRRQRYTSVANLNVAAMLTQLPEFIASRSQIRFARSITAEDLKSANVILLGSKHSNPWVSLFENNLNFRLEYLPEVDQSFVLNEHPRSGEQNKYMNGTGAPGDHTYGVIDYLPSLDGKGHVLILQGLNMAGTQAAADILWNSEEITPVLQQAVLPDGGLKPFELLVETRSIGATDQDVRILSTRFYSK